MDMKEVGVIQTAVLTVRQSSVQFMKTVFETPIKIFLLLYLFTFSWQHNVVQIQMNRNCMECYFMYLTLYISYRVVINF